MDLFPILQGAAEGFSTALPREFAREEEQRRYEQQMGRQKELDALNAQDKRTQMGYQASEESRKAQLFPGQMEESRLHKGKFLMTVADDMTKRGQRITDPNGMKVIMEAMWGQPPTPEAISAAIEEQNKAADRYAAEVTSRAKKNDAAGGGKKDFTPVQKEAMKKVAATLDHYFQSVAGGSSVNVPSKEDARKMLANPAAYFQKQGIPGWVTFEGDPRWDAIIEKLPDKSYKGAGEGSSWLTKAYKMMVDKRPEVGKGGAAAGAGKPAPASPYTPSAQAPAKTMQELSGQGAQILKELMGE